MGKGESAATKTADEAAQERLCPPIRERGRNDEGHSSGTSADGNGHARADGIAWLSGARQRYGDGLLSDDAREADAGRAPEYAPAGPNAIPAHAPVGRESLTARHAIRVPQDFVVDA